MDQNETLDARFYRQDITDKIPSLALYSVFKTNCIIFECTTFNLSLSSSLLLLPATSFLSIKNQDVVKCH